MEDSKQYLLELIDHYQFLLEQHPQQDWVNMYTDLIREELFKCQHQLRRIKEVDTEGKIMASVSAFRFLDMNLT
jgi:hypothetical protein